MLVDYCTACDKKIAVHYDGDYHRTADGGGPFCDGCWFFITIIQKLEKRINDLERATAKIREPVSNRSPYDLSKRRTKGATQ